MSDLAEMIAVYMEAVAAEAAAVTAAHAASIVSFEAQAVKDTAHHARQHAEAALLAHLRGDGGVA